MSASISLPNPPTRLIEEGSAGLTAAVSGNLVISVATAADNMLPWGYPSRQRDLQLRAFWPTEHLFASALFSVVAQYTAFGYSLKGPPRMVGITQEMLSQVQMGQGWESLLEPFLVDYFTCDNGAFMEIVRADNADPRSPVISLNHLDSCQCIRTGNLDFPVIYIDRTGRWHQLANYNVIMMSEFPSPIEMALGTQYCALTRILRACQTQRDIAVVKQEKAAGQFTRQIHLVSGVQTKIIEDAVEQKKAEAVSQGYLRYIQPLIIASLDPTARVSKETIDLASVPADYDEEKALHVYILTLAMAFGTDYQAFAPLPSGGMGSSSSQSKMLNMKARGKGPKLFMQKLARLFNFHGLLPRSVTFEFGDHDIAEQMELTELARSRALEREIRIRSGEITTEVARQIAVDTGDLDPRYLEMMHEANATQEVTGVSTVPIASVMGNVEPGMPGPKSPPLQTNSAVARPANSNQEIPRAPSQDQKRNPGGAPEQPGTRP